MSRQLAPIPSSVPIVEEDGSISVFFRQMWEAVRVGFQTVPNVGTLELLNQHAAVVQTTVYTTKAAGWYRISGYQRVTTADGAASNVFVTARWTETGAGFSNLFISNGSDSIASALFGSVPFYADAFTDITIETTYTSTTPNKMGFSLRAMVEQIV